MRRASSSMSLVEPTASFGSEQSGRLPEVELSLMKTPLSQGSEDKQSLKPQLSRRPGFNDAYNNIALAITVITVPFLVFVGLLFYVVFNFRVQRGDLSPNLQLPSDADDTHVYLVDYSATRLTTIASWASNIATILPGFVLTMSSYRLASIYLEQSKKAESNAVGARSLPTPYQLGLLLDMLDGKITALWKVLDYYFWKKRERLNETLRIALSLLTVALILNYSIWAADTWFHVSISTVPFSQLSLPKSALNAFGAHITPQCINWFNVTTITGIDPDHKLQLKCLSGHISIMSGDAYQIVNNLSDTHRVLTSSQNGSRFSFLAPADPPPGLDFRTSTFAVSSTCQPISEHCDLTDNRDFISPLRYNCSPSFQGSSSSTYTPNPTNGKNVNTGYPLGCQANPSGCVAFSADSSLMNITNPFNWTLSANTSRTNRNTNPFYAGILGQFQAEIGSRGSSQSLPLISDPQIVKGAGGGFYGFILGCDLAVYNLTYSWINDSIVSSDLEPSDDDIAELMREGLKSSNANGGAAFFQLSYSTILAYLQSNTSQQLADNYAQQLEKNMLALSGNIWKPLTNIEEQVRHNLLVARVPKAPLFVLILLCLLFVILGLVLFVVAVKGQNAEARELQARLNAFGVIASRFETAEKANAPVSKMEDMFAERGGESSSTRIGMVRSSEGGWAYSSSFEEKEPAKVNPRINR